MAFEHIISLLSFVYALALTHLLLSVAALLRRGRKVRFSWIHAGWMLNACLLIIENWIVFYGLRTLTTFSIGTIFFLFALAFTNYMYAALVAVDPQAENDIDLSKFHDEQAARYIPAFIVCVLFELATGTVVSGRFSGFSAWVAQNLTLLPMTGAAILAYLFVRVRWVQALSLAAIFASWAYFMVVLQGSLR